MQTFHEHQKELEADTPIVSGKTITVLASMLFGAIILGNLFGILKVTPNQPQGVIYGTVVGIIIGFLLSIVYVSRKA